MTENISFHCDQNVDFSLQHSVKDTHVFYLRQLFAASLFALDPVLLLQ